MTNIQVPDIGAIAQRKAQQEAMLQTEIRRIAGEIYAGMVSRYLVNRLDPPEPAALKAFAEDALKAAPYLHQAAGIININEEEHWK